MADQHTEQKPETGVNEQADSQDKTQMDICTDDNETVDELLGAGAHALQDSIRMFGESPKSAETKCIKLKESLNAETQDVPNENIDHVDDVLGAGAHALHHSALMFGDPLKKSDGPKSTENESQDTDDDDGGFICEEEMDVTRHDDFFNIDVRIRLIEERDEKAIRALIYDGIYVAALNRYILNATERPFVVCFIGLLAVLFSWLFGSIMLALFLSVVVFPLGLYIYVRYIGLAIHRRSNLPEVQSGIYKYWTATNEGRVMWVAEIEGKVVGSVAVETHSAIVAEMKHLSVHPEWQCLGIGGRLAQHALSHMKRRRFKKVMSHVLSIHNEAANMYTKLGFRRTNVRKVFSGFCSLEDFDLNLSTGSRANLMQEE